MPVSQDFKDSMRILQMEMQKLQRENATLRKEFDDLKKLVEASDEVNVRKKDDVVKRAAISGDVDKINSLATDANSIVQDEMLRQALPVMQPQSLTVTKIRGDLVDNFIQAFTDGHIEKFPFTRKEKEPRRKPNYNAQIAGQLRANSQQMLLESELQKKRIADRERRSMKEQKERNNALARFSPIWEIEE